MTASIRTLQDLQDAIAGRRVEVGLSQSDLDRAAGLRRNTIKRFEERGQFLADLPLERVLAALRMGLALRLRPGQSGRLAA